MGKINWGRVVLGGVLWSVVYNVLAGAAWYLFLKNEWSPVLEKLLGRPFQESASLLVSTLVLTLVGGLFSIWFYAAIRPRYGPGPKTAVGAAFALWLAVGLAPMSSWVALGVFPMRLVALNLGVALVAFIAATLVGAWPYKE